MEMNSRHVVVVGGGASGCAAALEAIKAGVRVTLIDEHPQSMMAISQDAPYFYGARLPSVLSDESLIAERVFGANERLLDCLEAGVDVITGTAVWGSFHPGPNNVLQDIAQLAVADNERSWLIDYDYLILAAGSRDLVMSFPGWELPGVLGANGATALMSRYEALGGNKMVVLGSGNLGLRTAKLALSKGIDVVAIVDVMPSVQGDVNLANELKQAGVQFHLATVVSKAFGQTEVQGIQLVGETTFELACDTICIAVGAVPNIELAAVTGCQTEFDGSLGGWVPKVSANMQTSISNVFVVGDGAGLTSSMLLDECEAEKQSCLAVQYILDNIECDVLPQDPAPRVKKESLVTYPPHDWLDAFVKEQGLDVTLCQCEEVTRQEFLNVSPPSYLKAKNVVPGGGLKGLSEVGQISQDFIKRFTRVGMGHCQGKRCRDQSLMLLAESAGKNDAEMHPGSYRNPVRLIPMQIIADENEPEDVRANWVYWPTAPDNHNSWE